MDGVCKKTGGENARASEPSIECTPRELVYVALPFASALRHSGLAAIV